MRVQAPLTVPDYVVRSSIGRAQGCEPCRCEFESRRTPQKCLVGSVVECLRDMEEVVGSIPTRGTKNPAHKRCDPFALTRAGRNDYRGAKQSRRSSQGGPPPV